MSTYVDADGRLLSTAAIDCYTRCYAAIDTAKQPKLVLDQGS